MHRYLGLAAYPRAPFAFQDRSMRRLLGRVGRRPPEPVQEPVQPSAPDRVSAPAMAGVDWPHIETLITLTQESSVSGTTRVEGVFTNYRDPITGHSPTWSGLYTREGDFYGATSIRRPEGQVVPYIGPIKLPENYVSLYRNADLFLVQYEVRDQWELRADRTVIHGTRITDGTIRRDQLVAASIASPSLLDDDQITLEPEEDTHDIVTVIDSSRFPEYYRVAYSRTFNGHQVTGSGFFHKQTGVRHYEDRGDPASLNAENLRAVYVDRTAPPLRMLPKPPVPLVYTSTSRMWNQSLYCYVYRVYGFYDNRTNQDEPSPDQILGCDDIDSWEGYYDEQTGQLLQAGRGITPPPRINLRDAVAVLDASDF